MFDRFRKKLAKCAGVSLVADQSQIKSLQIAHLIAKIDYDLYFEALLLQSADEASEIIRRAFKILRGEDDIVVGFPDLREKVVDGAKGRREAAIAAHLPGNIMMTRKGAGDAGLWIEEPVLGQLAAIAVQLHLDRRGAGFVGSDMKKALAHGPSIDVVSLVAPSCGK